LVLYRAIAGRYWEVKSTSDLRVAWKEFHVSSKDILVLGEKLLVPCLQGVYKSFPLSNE
jgi:hypothetical protein